MRWMYAAVDLRKGEFRIERPYKGLSEVGVLRIVGPLSRSASVHSLLVDAVRCVPGHHLYLVAKVSKVDGAVPGLYQDAEVEGLSWVVLPTSDMRMGAYPSCFFYEQHLKLFQDLGSNTPLPLDAVCAFTPFMARRAWMQFSSANREVPAFVRHESSYGPNGNVHETWGQPGRNVAKAEAIAAESTGIHHIFLSPKDRKHYTAKFIRPYLSAATQRRIGDKTTVIRNGVDLDTLDAWVEEWGGFKTDRGRTVGSFSRPTAQKGTPQVLELYQRMATANQIDRAVVTWNRSTKLEEVIGEKPASQFDFYPNADRKSYLQRAAECACFISNSTNESSPFLVAECMAVGAVPILPNREWVKDLPEEWPLVYRGMDEAARLVHKVLDEQEEWIPRAREYARTHFSGVVLFGKLIDHMRENALLANKFPLMTKEEFHRWCADSKFVENVEKALGDAQSVAWPELMAQISLPRDNFGEPVLLTHHDLVELIQRRFPYEDDLSSPVPKFVRV